MVHIFQSALFQTNAAVIETEDLILVADPNWLPEEVLQIHRKVESLRGNRPVYLLFTHSDYDHIIGYKAFENVTTIASSAFVRNRHKKRELKQILTFDDSYYIRRPYPVVYPAIDIEISADGQSMQIGNTVLTFYLSPGHNADGIIAIVNPGGYLIAGDYLCDVEFPYIYHSSTEYEKTLDRFEAVAASMAIGMLIPGHGNTTSDPQEIRRRISVSRQYILGLRQHVKTGQPFDLTGLLGQYAFPGIQRKFHEGNIRLLKRENK